MIFRLFLIAIVGWAMVKLYRLLTGGAAAARRGGTFGGRRNASTRRYDGKAVDAEFEDLDNTNDSR
ncbi:MAG: hypothetical protein RBU27_00470 [Bacteroidota bacterium]|jgi:hypothetical protein|nr:hypothetical protein [Bacteroidota bacterium]